MLNDSELIYKNETFKIIGAAIEVHKTLGPGFLEAVYHEALEVELDDQGIPFESRKPLNIMYKGRALKKEYIVDMLCYGKIIVELKALNDLSGKEDSQLVNYL